MFAGFLRVAPVSTRQLAALTAQNAPAVSRPPKRVSGPNGRSHSETRFAFAETGSPPKWAWLCLLLRNNASDNSALDRSDG